jgi:hypothetical protein
MSRLTWDQARVLVERGSRPWGLPEGTPPSIREVPGSAHVGTEYSDFAKRFVRKLRKVLQEETGNFD